MTTQKTQPNMIARPPVVAVLGHIDHGKTTLLDYIRKSTVAAKESGGITQHMGAYEVEHALEDGTKQRITFLDTPGHEAFSKMRARGAKVADIAVLVVAADEGIKPQTLEALEHIQASGATLVVAINKIDKPEAKPERVKQQLAEKGLLLEGWGGTVPNQELSAKTGKGIPDLLSLLLLVADLAELKADPSVPAEGVIIESHKDARVGNIATLLIRNGTLNQGDYVVAGGALGKIRSIAVTGGTTTRSAQFSSPVVVSGFESLPAVGDTFRTTKDKKEAEVEATQARQNAKDASLTPRATETVEGVKPILNVVLKADVAGTKEALEKMIGDMNFTQTAARVVKSDVGEVGEGDVAFAESVKGIIAAFKVKPAASAAKLIQNKGVTLLSGETVYELADAVKVELRKLLPPEVVRSDLGKVSILATFKMDKSKMVVGGKVSDGKIKKGAKAEVKRKGAVLYSGKITQLQHNKADVAEVQQGRECGMMITMQTPQENLIQAGDELVIYEEEMALRELEKAV